MKKLALLLGIALAGCGKPEETKQNQPIEQSIPDKGVVRRQDYTVETDFEKGTIKFYQNGDRRGFSTMYTTHIPKEIQTDPEKTREYTAGITYGLDKIITHGRNTAHKEQLQQAGRPEYTGKEVVETYFQTLDGNDGALDGRISMEEFNTAKLQKWLNMNDAEFRKTFKLYIDLGADRTSYGGKREPTFQELLEQERNEGKALGESLRRAKQDSERLRIAYDSEASQINREWQAKEAAAQYGK